MSEFIERNDIIEDRNWSEWACALYGGPDAIAEYAAARLNRAVDEARMTQSDVIDVDRGQLLISGCLTGEHIRKMTLSDFNKLLLAVWINFQEALPDIPIHRDDWTIWKAECMQRGIEILAPVFEEHDNVQAIESILLKLALHQEIFEEVCLPNPCMPPEMAEKFQKLREKYRQSFSLPGVDAPVKIDS